jgi:hypothetical protein
LCFGSFVVGGEVDIWVVATVVFFDVLVRNKELGALVALVEISFLLGRKFKQVLVSREGLLLDFKFFFQRLIFLAIKLDFVADFCSVFVSLLVMKVERFGERFKVVLSVDKIFNRKLAKSEQLDKMCVAHSF